MSNIPVPVQASYPTVGSATAPTESLLALLDPRRLFMIFLRRLWLFVAVCGLVTSSAILLAQQETPMYKAEASVLIEPRQRDFVDIQAVVSGLPSDNNTIDTEASILGSRATAELVVQRLGLHLDPEFSGNASIVDGARPNADGQLAQSGAGLIDAAVDRLLGRISVRRAGQTYIITVTARSPDPEKAARIANAFVEQYVRNQLDVKRMANTDATEVLQTRMDDLRIQAEAADAAIQQYKVANGLMSANGSTLTEQEVSTLNSQIARAQEQYDIKLAELRQAEAQISRGNQGADVAAALGSGTVSSLRQTEAQAAARVAELSQTRGELHPELIQAKSQHEAAQRALQAEIDRTLIRLRGDVEIQRVSLNSLIASQKAARDKLAGNNRAMVGLQELTRRADASRGVYEAFLNRAKETSAQEDLAQADARVLARAQVPTWPYSPNVKLAAMFALAAGLALGFLAIAIAEYLDSSIQTGTDVERRFGVRYAGAVPTLRSTLRKRLKGKLPYDYLVEHPFSAFAESLRSLRTFLLFPAQGEPPKVIALSSALPREGKSITSLCLARTIAMAGQKVVLLDCDLRRHGLTDLAPGDARADIAAVLAGEAAIEDAIYRDSKTEARIIGATTPSAEHRDLFSTAALSSVLEQLKAEYDVILIDTAPVLAVAETRVIAAQADAVLMLSHWRKTPFKATDSAIDLLLEAGCDLVGLALTQVNLKRQAATGYGDRYYYYKSYARYYSS